jgi:hypothetical protein
MRTNLVAAPATEPVTLAEAKAHLRLELGYTADDATVADLIVAAREALEVAARSAFLSQTWDLFLDRWHPPRRGLHPGNDHRGSLFSPLFLGDASEVRLPLPPLQSVTSVQYYDQAGTLQTLDPATYIVSATNQPSAPGRIYPVPNTSWPLLQAGRLDAIQIRFLCGQASAAAVPTSTKLAIKILVALYYEGRETPGAVPDGIAAMLGRSESGAYS